VSEIGFAPVDVRDVAIAHRLAMELPQAAGNRYICAGEHLWVQDMAKVLRRSSIRAAIAYRPATCPTG